jgi:hypothetical protein
LLVRVLNGLYRSEAAKQKGKFNAIKEDEAKMRKFATTASEQLTQYYLDKGLENDDRNLQTQISILNSLSGLDATIRESVHVMEEGLKKIIIEGFNDLKKQQTPFGKLDFGCSVRGTRKADAHVYRKGEEGIRGERTEVESVNGSPERFVRGNPQARAGHLSMDI